MFSASFLCAAFAYTLKSVIYGGSDGGDSYLASTLVAGNANAVRATTLGFSILLVVAVKAIVETLTAEQLLFLFQALGEKLDVVLGSMDAH